MSELKDQAMKGVKWTTLSAVVITIGGLAQIFILSRLLSPADFGAMAIINIALGLSLQVVDFGFSNAIVQAQQVKEGQLNALFWLNVTMGLVMAVLMWVAAPWVESFFNIPNLTSMLRWITPAFLLGGIASQSQALFQKKLHFKRLALVEITAFSAGFVVALVCGFRGMGVWSLLAGALVRSLFSSFLLVGLGLRFHNRSLRAAFEPLGELWSFGTYQVVERLVGYVTINLDSLLIGRFLGQTALGVYDVMKRLLIQPWYVINPVITKVTFPVLSKVTHDQERFTNIALRSLNMVAVVNAPIYLGCALGASYVVNSFFDARWSDGILVFQWLSMYFLVRALLNPLGAIAMAKGKANLSLAINVVIFFALIVAFNLTYQSGLPSVLRGMLVVNAFLVVPFFYLIAAPVIKVGWYRFLKQMVPEILLSVLAFVLALFATVALPFSDPVLLMVYGTLGVLLYAAGLYLLRPQLFEEVKQLLQR